MIFEAIAITANAASCIFQFATFGWTKTNIIKLVVTAAIFIASTAFIAVKAKKEKAASETVAA